MTDPEPAPAVRPSPPAPFDSERAARTNFRLSVWNGVLFLVGETFIDSATVLALFVSRLTDRNWLVGLAVSLHEIGWYLPQVLTIPILEQRARRLTLYRQAAFIRVGGLLVVTVSVFLLGDRQPGLLLAIFLAGFMIFAFAGGFAAVSFYDVVGRTIPMSRHGKLWAYRLFFGGILSALCGVVIGAILGIPDFALRYGILFAVATLFIGLGTTAFTFSDEPAVEVSRKALHMGAHLRENVRVAWRDPAFRALFGTRVALAASGMATPFYVVYAVRTLGLPPVVVAGFISAKIAGFVASNLLWQRIASRHGPTDLMRRVTVTAAAGPLLALAAAAAPEAGRGPLLTGTFFLLGASVSGTSIAFQSLLLGIAPAARRPSYVGLMNSFVGPATALPALGGLLVDFTAPWVIFGLSVGCAALAFALAGRLPRGVTIEATRPPGREGEPEQA